MPKIKIGEWSGLLGFISQAAELFGSSNEIIDIIPGGLSTIAVLLLALGVFLQGREIRQLEKKIPEYWDNDLLRTNYEARKSFKHVFDTVVKIEDPELVDAVLNEMSRENENLWLSTDKKANNT